MPFGDSVESSDVEPVPARGVTARARAFRVVGADYFRSVGLTMLAGREFITKWNERSPGELIAQIRATMPPSAPASLSEESAAALAALLLEANGARAGNELLTAAATGRIADALVGPPTGPPASAPGAGQGGGAPEPTGLTVAGSELSKLNEFIRRGSAAVRGLFGEPS